MSKPGVIYRIDFDDMESVATTVDIFDQSVQIDDAADPQVIELTPYGSPLVIDVINNERDKFQPIRAKQAIIKFASDRNLFQESTTFADAADDNWLVKIYRGADILFWGFLVLNDIGQAFLPDPNIVTLTASDHLGALKDIDLSDDEGKNPEGEYRLAELVALCLKKTGLSLNIRVVNNLRHGSATQVYLATFSSVSNRIIVSSTDPYFYIGQQFVVSGTAFNDREYVVESITPGLGVVEIGTNQTITSSEATVSTTFTDLTTAKHFYDGCYLDAATFETDRNEYDDCYSVLEKIFREECYVTQYAGEWWIKRVDEMQGVDDDYVALFSADGIFDLIEELQFVKNIGAGEDVFWALASEEIAYDRPHKTVRLNYDYQTPEIPRNGDFSQGDFIADLDSENKSYEVDYWHLRRNFPTSPQTTLTDPYIKRKFNNLNYEVERVLVMPNASSFSHQEFLECKVIPMGLKDRFDVSVDWRLQTASGFSAQNVYFMQVVLRGIDGTDWILGADHASNPIYNPATSTGFKWWNTSNFTANTLAGQWALNFSEFDEQEFQDQSYQAPPLPREGKVYIWLNNFKQVASSNADKVIEYANLSLTYYPYINGSYQKYTGQYSQVDRNPSAGYLTKREVEVQMSDSPKPLFKGGLKVTRKSDELYDGDIIFATGPYRFQMDGNETFNFIPGLTIYIDAPSFQGYVKIVSASYSIIGDTTTVIVSGAILPSTTETGTIYLVDFVLTSRFYNAAPFSLGSPPDSTYLHPYGHIQAFSVWNQYRNANRIFPGSLKNLPTGWPDLIYNYFLTDADYNTNNRAFMLISFSQDYKSTIWSAVFVEVYNTATGKVYSDTFTFKFISGEQ